MNKWLDLAEKLFLVLITIGVVVYILLAFNFWADEWKTFFLGSGNIEWFIYICLLLFIMAYVFKRLLKWEIHSAFKRRRR